MYKIYARNFRPQNPATFSVLMYRLLSRFLCWTLYLFLRLFNYIMIQLPSKKNAETQYQKMFHKTTDYSTYSILTTKGNSTLSTISKNTWPTFRPTCWKVGRNHVNMGGMVNTDIMVHNIATKILKPRWPFAAVTYSEYLKTNKR